MVYVEVLYSRTNCFEIGSSLRNFATCQPAVVSMHATSLDLVG